jgi:hypothetical protein
MGQKTQPSLVHLGRLQTGALGVNPQGDLGGCPKAAPAMPYIPAMSPIVINCTDRSFEFKHIVPIFVPLEAK